MAGDGGGEGAEGKVVVRVAFAVDGKAAIAEPPRNGAFKWPDGVCRVSG